MWVESIVGKHSLRWFPSNSRFCRYKYTGNDRRSLSAVWLSGRGENPTLFLPFITPSHPFHQLYATTLTTPRIDKHRHSTYRFSTRTSHSKIKVCYLLFLRYIYIFFAFDDFITSTRQVCSFQVPTT